MKLHNMFKAGLLSFCLAIGCTLSLNAQVRFELKKTDTDSTVRELLLRDLKIEHHEESERLESEIEELNKRLAELDQRLEKEKDDKKIIATLTERVQILELKEKFEDNTVLGVYQYNYKAATTNLIFMERSLKPLALFQNSKDFFATLNDVGNPMNYKGYQEWFEKFKAYVDKHKKSEARLQMVDRFLQITSGTASEFSKGIPLSGPITNGLFSGISLFIESLSKKSDRALREESVKMFELTSVLSQYTHDINLIETEWEEINKELEALQKLQAEYLQENFKILGITDAEFKTKFSDEADANKYVLYVSELRSKIDQIVAEEQKQNPKEWKNKFYGQMQVVQSLMVRFGTLTFRIQENITKYRTLIDKYEDVEFMAPKMKELSKKLDDLNNSFGEAFNPQSIIHAASSMYHVE